LKSSSLRNGFAVIEAPERSEGLEGGMRQAVALRDTRKSALLGVTALFLPRQRSRHCEELATKQSSRLTQVLDCFASLAMTSYSAASA
jgi:hypothetical protein